MDEKGRCLGDPHAATRPPPVPPFSVPYTAPVSCPLPQPTAANPILHLGPHQVSTPYVTPNSLQLHTLGWQYTCHQQPPTLTMLYGTNLSHYSAAPYTVQPHVTPDIAGSLQQPQTQRSPPCSHDFRYGSIESLADDIHEHESVQSRQIHYDDIVSDQLLNRDPIGDEEAKDVIHSSVDVSGSIYGSKDGIYDSGNVVFARREPTHVVEHNRVDITMLSNKIDSFSLKEDGDGSIEEVKKLIASFNADRVPSQYIVENHWVKREGAYIGLQVNSCVYVVWHVGDVTSINRRSTFLDADARLIPPCNDTQCLGIHGCVDRLPMLALNSHKHNLRGAEIQSADG